MAQTISTIIAWTLGAMFIGLHIALYAWGISLAKPEVRRSCLLALACFALLVAGATGCTYAMNKAGYGIRSSLV
jgi:molybdopterin/thiamine biosynthesis adenylyltransferase